ncbi:CBL-interacting protein kinase 18-like [Olea europaea var. sylvestris]|uniref:CBL-interacting protein kinase 18-like n=1 Tax=Olea europaea var. sylvestris TaxID=158386 RepID=UPI000C1D6510|nr:CBL-interacting protein kinase 18-like [Olea europaea var. sylvestris]
MEKKGSVLMGKYELGRLLGQGTFAKVYYGILLKTGQSVAIKVIDKDKVLKAGLTNQTKREISVMGMVKHNNVMELYEVMATKTKIYFVMEYAKGGELFHKVAKGRLKEDSARKYFQQLISAVGICHSRGVYHRDLKPENLLLDENGDLKVSDFGLCALTESKRQDGLLHTACGTPAYIAPEVIRQRGYDGSRADIWSCGVILFAMLAGYLPFKDSNLMEMYRKISRAEYKFPNWFPPEVRKLLSQILDPNPYTRISIDEIMQNSWFKKGLNSRQAMTKAEDTENVPLDFDSISVSSWNDIPTDTKLEVDKPANLNAFDIISHSTGFDLSGLFVSNDQKDEVQFTSTKPVSAIISKLEDVAGNLKFRVKKKDQGLMRLEGFKGMNGILSIDVEIFEITSSFHLIEMKKSSGDSVDYQMMLKQDVRPALREIVWTWQGELQQGQKEG